MDIRLQHGNETRKRRKAMICNVFTLKIDKSHLSSEQQKFLSKTFLETKWFYNYCLSQPKLSNADHTAKVVPVKLKDGSLEDRRLETLSGTCRQAIKNRIFASFKTLATLKAKGKKVGRVKFKKHAASLPFPKIGLHGACQVFPKDNRIQIAKAPNRFKVSGMEQIPQDAEFANANLLNKHGEYFLQVTCFTNKDEQYIKEQHEINQQRKNKSLGLDFGTSSAKVVIGDHGSDQSYAVPFLKSIGINAYLLPSRVFLNSQTSSAKPLDQFDLTQSLMAFRDLKLGLLGNPFDRDRQIQVIAFLAQVIHRSRSWFFSTHS